MVLHMKTNFTIKDDRLIGAGYFPTKNYTHDSIINPKFLVFHAIQHTLQYAWDYMEDATKSCPHIQIARTGEIYQRCLLNERAWHCGASYWQGYSGLNSVSIGIQLESTEDNGFTDSQLEVLDAITPLIVETYRIRDIITAYDATPVERHYYDPTIEFPIHRYRQFVQLGNANSLGRYVVTGHIRTYAGPSAEFDYIDTLDKGDGVTVLREDGDWRLISYQKESQDYAMGWVHDTFIKRV